MYPENDYPSVITYQESVLFVIVFMHLFTTVMCASLSGIDFKQKIINLDGTPIKLQIW